jgi:hypothetical protein
VRAVIVECGKTSVGSRQHDPVTVDVQQLHLVDFQLVTARYNECGRS